jgi:hypothetical protein
MRHLACENTHIFFLLHYFNLVLRKTLSIILLHKNKKKKEKEEE